MGISTIPPVPEVRPDQQHSDFIKELQTSAREVALKDVVADADGLLTVGGLKVAAYIRDQASQGIDTDNQSSSYRFHLCNCRTIRRMRASGRERRYLATKRKDGWFEVSDKSDREGKKVRVRLELCWDCRPTLRKRGLDTESFDLKEYFTRHESEIPRTIRREEDVPTRQVYAPNQSDLSREYRKAVNYKCQLCQVSCQEKPELLHLHHKDGDASRNAPDNLQVLCVECHSRQPYHGHLKRLDRNRRHIEEIRTLRRAQGLPGIDLE